MISQTVEYALRAIVALARHADRPQTSRELADATRVPVAYLSKILHTLTRAGLARSQRGPGGGFTLGRPPADLTVWDIVEAVEPIKPIKECPLGGVEMGGHGADLCPLHQRLEDARRQVELAFRATTIEEVVSNKQRPALCSEPREPRPLAAP